MNWINQFSLIMRSNLTSIRESVEDPERMLHQLLIDMEEELDRVRSSVAEAVADEIQLRRRCERAESAAETWLSRATESMRRGNEGTAKEALEQKMQTTETAQRLRADHQQQKAEVEKLQRSLADLEDKIRQARHKKTLLTARITRAQSSQKISAALERTHSKSAFAQFSKLEEKVDRQEALGQAWDRLDGKDPDADALEQQFEREEREQKLANELAQLKSTIGE